MSAIAISNVNGNAVAATKDALAAKLAAAKAEETKDTPQAMQDASTASKEVVAEKVAKTVEASNATTRAALKSDTVQISEEAKRARDNTDKFNSAAEATKEAAAAKSEAAKEALKDGSAQITQRAVKAKKEERIAKAKRSRITKVSKASKAVKTNKAEMAAKAEKAAKEGKAERAAQAERAEKAAKADKAEKAPRQSIFAKKDAEAQAASAPQKSIFAMEDDKSTLLDKAADRNEEKSEEAKAAAKNSEKTAMAAKPAIAAEAKITEKRGNIAEDVGDHLTTTTEKTVENSALKTGDTHPGEKGTGIVSEKDKGSVKEVESADEKSRLGEFVSGLKEMFGNEAGVEAELSEVA